MDNIIEDFEANIGFSADSNSSHNKEKYWKYGNKEKWGKVNYKKFQNSGRYLTGELIHEICEHCGKKKCSCGGCPDTDVFKWVAKSSRILPCRRCICHDIISTADVSESSINDTGKTLDQLVKERMQRGKALKEFTVEDYENGWITKSQLSMRKRKGVKNNAI